MKHIPYWMNVLVLLLLSSTFMISYSWAPQLSSFSMKFLSNACRLKAFPDDHQNREAVDELLKELAAKLRARSGFNGDDLEVNEELTIEELTKSFDRTFADLKQQSISEIDQMKLAMEALRLADEEIYRKDAAEKALKTLPIDYFKTSIYSAATAPVLIVYGPGAVSERVLQITKSLGQAVSYQYTDAAKLEFITDAELRLAVRDVKTVIIAADGKQMVKTGWFGAQEVVEAEPVISNQGMKRLLNAIMNEKNRQQYAIKVVALCKACKPPKPVASFLVGDTTDYESEVILLCSQRQLPYNIIKVGKLVPDSEAVSTNVKNRALTAKSAKGTGREIPSQSLVITDSKVIESTECTKHSIAAEALLRATTINHRNATVSVLSVPGADKMPSESDWNDEFLKVDGPELLRIPLRFASADQGQIMLRRFMRRLQEPDRGIVTPIKVELLANALRIEFKPAISSYTSSKEEKQQAKEKSTEEDEEKMRKQSAQHKSIRKSGYTSPEEEMKLSAMNMDDESRDGKATPATNESSKKAKQDPLEGGLDIIVEFSPYPRVRVRRCLMGPKTIVKIESEKVILALLQREVERLEADYRILSSLVKK